MKKIYIRDGTLCDICGHYLCFENAYSWEFPSNDLTVCNKCKNKEPIVIYSKDIKRGEQYESESGKNKF